MSDIKHVCKKSDLPFARGNVKRAYEVKECVDFASNKDTTQMVIVNFTGDIKWINPSNPSNRWQPTRNGNQIIKFKTKMINEPQFKYDIRNLINTYKADGEATKIPIIEEFPEIDNLDKLIKWFNENDQQFDYINELKKMNELSKLGLAPELYQIRINSEAPFSPDEIDAKIAEIKDGDNPIQISYLAEKCGGDIALFISSIENSRTFSYMEKTEKTKEFIQKMCEFCDTLVDRTGWLNCDLKYENLCPIIAEGRIVSIRLLDVDPKYSIEKKGNPDFSRHAKVFMKFFIFTYLLKRKNNYQLSVSKWGVSDVEVREMIAFFYGMDYMIYEFNPINMMYHYLIKKHPLELKTEEEHDYAFLGFDDLKKYFTTDEEMIAVFGRFIGAVRGGAKKRKSKKAKKAKKVRKTKHVGR
jgi:hypothetical protein